MYTQTHTDTHHICTYTGLQSTGNKKFVKEIDHQTGFWLHNHVTEKEFFKSFLNQKMMLKHLYPLYGQL